LKERHLIAKNKEILEKLIGEQNYPSGINKESAFGYMYQVVDYFFLSYLVSIRISDPFSIAYRNLLIKMFDYMAKCLDCKNNFFDYGDRDDGNCLDVSFLKRNPFVTLCNSGAIFFCKQEWIKSSELDERNYILFGSDAKDFLEQTPKLQFFSAIYHDAGHIICNFQDFKRNNIFFHFKAGKLGYLNIAAHGHSDLLSFFLSINGNPIFVDSGTYCYRYDQKYRNYFRSSLAHNTVRINGRDQSTAFGSHHWSKNVKADLLSFENEEDFFSISSRFKYDTGEIHERRFLANKKKFELKIYDELTASNILKENTFEQTFQLGESVHVEQNENTSSLYLTCLKNIKMQFMSSEMQRVKIVRGQKEGFLLGWKSDSFLRKKEIDSIYIANNFSRFQKILTVIKIIE
jgi:hypothetical protein